MPPSRRCPVVQKVAWRKRNLFRNVQTQRKWGPRKELSSGKWLTHRAEVARRKEQGIQRQVKNSSAPRTPTGRTSRKKRRKEPECKKGIKDPRTRRHLSLQIERTTEEFNGKALGLEFLKRATGTSSGLLKIRNWTLCGG
jgi:hypothetical protein